MFSRLWLTIVLDGIAGPDARRLRRGPGAARRRGSASSGTFGSGYGSNSRRATGPTGVGYGSSGYGYGVRTGQIGSGYQSAGQLYPPGLPGPLQAPDDHLVRAALQRDHVGARAGTARRRRTGPGGGPIRPGPPPRSPSPSISTARSDGPARSPTTPRARDCAARRRHAVPRRRPGVEVHRPCLDPAGDRRQGEALGLRAEGHAGSQGQERHRRRRPRQFFFDLDNALDTLTYTY